MFNIYATDYAPVDPITPPCDIVPIFIGYKGENKARCLVFDLTECVETFGDGGFVVSFIRQGDELPYLVTETDRLDNNAIWIITDTDTAVDGYGMVQLQYIVDDVVCKSALYRTVTFDSNGITGDVPDPYEDLLAQIAAYAAQAEGAATTATAAAATATTAVENGIVTERSQRIAADEGLNTRINELMGLAGAPSMAATAAAMTDSNKVYVYTGNEAGYLTGHWYYYNGSEWADGGVYQATAVDTDKTLTVENMAADAAVVGEKIDECMAAFVTETASGSIASFTDGADDVPLKDLVVNISPVQSGTGDPSPTNIRPITGWTGANIIRCGANFLGDNAYTSRNADFILINNGDGSYTINGTCTSSKIIVYNFYTDSNTTLQNDELRHLQHGQYWLDAGCNNTGVKLQICGTNITGTSDVHTIAASNATLVTVDDTYKYNWVRLLISTGTYENVTLRPFIVRADDSNRAYTKYEQDLYSISFGSAGTVYGGTLDVTSGMLTVTHGYGKVSDYDNWAKLSSCLTYYHAIYGKKQVLSSEILCDKYKFLASTNRTNYTITGSNSTQAVYITNDSYTTPEQFMTAEADTEFVYELAQPVSYQLTPTEVKTLLGNNNIWSDTGSVASCEYRADTKLYLEKLTTPDGDMIADSNITSGSYFMVNNNLYLATANIANGGAITPGTNCTATNLAAALNAINS